MPGRLWGGPAGAARLRAVGVPVVRTQVEVVAGRRAVLRAASVAMLVVAVSQVRGAVGAPLAASRGVGALRAVLGAVAIEVVPVPEVASIRAVVMTRVGLPGGMAAGRRAPVIGHGPGLLGSGLRARAALA